MTEEGQIQKTVFEHLRKRGKPGIVFWHVPNDKTSRRKSGFRSGVHDVHVLHRGEFFTLELKRAKGGTISEDQFKFRDDINNAGGFSCIVEGLPQALACLESWGVIRPGNE